MLRTELIRPLSELLREHADRFGAKPAYRDARRVVGYADLEARSRRLAGHLADLRVQPGDRVALLLGNRVEAVESYHAVTRAAAIGVPIGPRCTDPELTHVLDDSGARLVIADAAHVDRLQRLRESRPGLGVLAVAPAAELPPDVLSFPELAAAEPDVPARDDLGLDEIAWMLYTSGTTGAPKGVLSTQRNCLWSVAACYAPVLGLSPEDRVLWPLPLFHSLSHIACVLAVTAVGASARLVDGYSPDEVLDALHEDRSTVFAGVPTTYHHLVRAVRDKGFRAPALRVGLVGGAVTTAELRGEVERTFDIPLIDAYGSTETCGSIAVNWPTGSRVEGSCGLPVPGLGVRLVDPRTGQDVATEAEGEVWVHGPNVMAGYHNQPEATAAVLREGWYRTGDLARRDESGYLRITGRIKELIIRAGENIHPGEVEEVLRTVPGVADVGVAGKPHEVLGEVPVAFVVPGPRGPDPAAIFEACREQLSGFKVPEELYEIDRVPRTASGKITRHVLLELPARLLAAGGQLDSVFRTEWVPRASVRSGSDSAEQWAVVGGPEIAEALADGFPVRRFPDVAALRDASVVPDVVVFAAAESGEVAAWLDDERAAGGRVVATTRRAVSAGESDDVPLPGSAASWDLLGAVQADRPGRLVLVDLDAAASARALRTAVHCGEQQLAVRAGVVLAPRLARTSASAGEAAPVVGGGAGTVVVTGAHLALAAMLGRHLVAAHGARHVLLLSPGGRRDRDAVELARALRRAGAAVALRSCELADRAALAAVLATAERPVRAVVHADPGQSDADSLQSLHESIVGVTAFVLCSRAADCAGLVTGPAAADALARRRRADGLPALSLTWGPREGDTGVSPDLGALTDEQVVAAFDAALTTGQPALSATRPSFSSNRRVPPLLSELIDDSAAPSPDASNAAALRRRIGALSEAEQERELLDLVRAAAARVLGVDRVAADRSFKEAGFGSVAAVELRNLLVGATGLRLPATLAFDHPTPSSTAKMLRAELWGDADRSSEKDGEVRPVSPVDDPVVVVGVGCRFPGVDSPEDFWELVRDGVDAVSDFPSDRGWDLGSLFDPDPDVSGSSYVRCGGFLGDVAGFDAGFFGVSPREAVAMDSQQRLLLEVSWEVFERAGVDPSSLRGKDIGVFTGLMHHDYGSGNRGHDEAGEGHRSTGTAGSVASGRVSYTLGLEGPAVTVDTACSSSLVAIHLAAQSIRQGECSMALAGGVTVMASPDTFVEFSRQRALAPDGRCKAFAAAADGTGWGEGVGILLLERLSEAERGGHRVLAVLRGSAVNQDGASNGLTAPNGPSQQRLIRQALGRSGLSASDVDVVEAHGTGTRLGDPIEAQALLATYGQGRSVDRPLWLGSVKSNIGHTQGAAGVAGVIKMVLAMRHGVLPKTLHVDEPSREVDWSSGDVRLLTEQREWPETGRPRRAAVSSFGVSGTNAHLILEHPPAGPPVGGPGPGGPVPLVVAATGEQALSEQGARLHSWFEDRPELAPSDLAHSLVTTRAALRDRAIVVAGGRHEAMAGLAALSRGEPAPNLISGKSDVDGRIAFVFPGQGAQWTGMAADLVRWSPVFAERMRECDSALAPLVEWSLFDVLDDAEALQRVDVVQPALFAIMVSLAELWRSAGVRPDVVVGHSQGEIAAACVADALSLPDAARVVVLRSRIIADRLAGRGGMVSVALPEDDVRNRVRDHPGLEIAAVNGPASVVVSGEPPALAALLAECEAANVRSRRIPVDYASHSAQVDEIHQELTSALRGLEPRPLRVPFYSTVSGEWVDGTGLDAEYWHRNLRRPVGFHGATRALLEHGCRAFVEVSPHPVLTGGVQESADAADVVVTGTLRRDEDGPVRFLTSAAELHARGVPVDWTTATGGPGTRRAELPTYPFQHRRYWPGPAPVASGVGAAGLTAAEHPLLGALVGLPESGGFLATGAASRTAPPWLGDHAVAGVVLLPATAFVELAFRAGAEVGADELRELVVERPLLLPEHGGVRLRLTVDDADRHGCRRLSVYSCPEDADAFESWTRHAHGLLAQEQAESEPDEAPGEWPPPGAAAVDIGDFYPRRHDDGYHYGPAFRGLRAVWRRGEEVFAEVALPEDQRPDAERYGLHPALLDAALHAGNFCTAEQAASGRTPLPFAWNEVRLRASGASMLRVRATPAGRDAVSLRLWDGTGAPVAAVGSLALRPVDTAHLVADGGPGRDVLFRIGWTELPSCDGDVSTASVRAAEDLRRLAQAEAIPEFVLADVEEERTGERPIWTSAASALELVQAWLAEPRFEAARLVLVTRGAVAVHGDGELRDPAAAAVWGLVRSAQSEHPDRLVLADVDAPGGWEAALAGGEPQLAVRAGVAFAPRLERAGDEPGLVPPENTTAWCLQSTGDTATELALVPAQGALGPLEPGQVRIQVRAAGVNFRDVLVSLDMVPGQRGLGGEAAGVVQDVGPGVTEFGPGDRVMGTFDRDFGAFGPVAVTDHRLLARIPAGWSFQQAATFPIAFLTACLGLHDIAGLRSTSNPPSVLVHAGAGGVGMAAIQLARHAGAEVFATASPAKWDVLRAMGVDDDHLASSRTAEFRDRFRATTGGRGVDVVLNSLTGELVDASLDLLPRGGAFLELGKTDVRDAAAMPAGVDYRAFDLREAHPDEIRRMLTELVELCERGVLTPLPSTAWDLRRASSAFRHVAQARHTGKVVLTVPREPDPDGTVLITGGTGTLGGLVARHLVAERGMRHLLLCGRSGPAAEGAADLVAELTGLGAEVQVAACDVADRDAVSALIAGIAAEHPLTAVVHAAGALDDGVVEALSPERFDAVFRSKVDGARNLHELTRGLDLAALVLFSSAAGVLGNPGQGNYAAANAALDGLAQRWHAAGAPVVSLAWGFWSEASGLTAHLGRADLQRNRRDGMVGLDSATAVAAFDLGMRGPDPVLLPARLDLVGLRAAGAVPPPLLRGLVRPGRRALPRASDDRGVARRLTGLAEPERRRALLNLVRQHAATVLGHSSPEVIDPRRVFKEAGFDSLTAVELRNRLSTATGLRLSATAVFDHPTPNELAAALQEELVGAPADPVRAGSGRISADVVDDPVVVVGVGCRFPGVDSPEGLWGLVRDGVDVVSDFPSDRGWDLGSLFDSDPDSSGSSYVCAGGFLGDVAG
ncbi:SDR family NAD(P)-dependent oxidoreductase, partial [Saccharopolyspora sp. NPDC002578]